MNNAFSFVIVLIIVVTCGQLAQTYLKQRAKRPEPDDELQDTLRQIDRLEERIQVLERIVTENKFDLKKEIDSL